MTVPEPWHTLLGVVTQTTQLIVKERFTIDTRQKYESLNLLTNPFKGVSLSVRLRQVYHSVAVPQTIAKFSTSS